MAKYMLIINEPPGAWERLSSEERQRKTQLYQGWVEKFRSSGRYVSGEKLGAEGGKLIHLQNGRPTVVDGPYVETKEVLGGYFLFRAANYDEAIELIRDCPMLKAGSVALRQTDPAGCGGE
jgi:hypothetical protein